MSFCNEASAQETGKFGSKTEEPLKGRISNLSEPNKFFTGREKEVEDIAHAFGKGHILVIEGISGIGKTQLAKQYAYASHRKYDLIWWFDADKSMETQIDVLLREIFRRSSKIYYRPAGPLGLVKKLQDALAFMGSSWLIIFDNVEDISTITPYVGLKNTDSLFKHVIVTSKKINKTYPALMIDKFQRTESLAFLSKILEAETEANLNELAETLGDFPLALAQAAGYIKANPSVSAKTYIELFKNSHSALWNAEEKSEKDEQFSHVLKDNYSKTISTTIKMNITSIKERSPLAYDLLCFCSLLHYHHIPLELLESWACDQRGASKLEFHEALSLLLNYFVLEKEKQTENEKNSELFNQHELIQLISLDFIDKDIKQQILKEAAGSIVLALSDPSTTLLEQFKEKEHFYNHMEKLCHLAEEINDNSPIILELKIARLYFVHFIQHNFQRSSGLIKSIKNELAQTHTLDPLAQIWFYCTLGNDQIFEDLIQAQQSYTKGMAYLEKIKDDEIKRSYFLHLSTNYVESLSNFGRLRETIALCDSLKETLHTSSNTSQKIVFLGVSAIIRLKYGQYDQALSEIDLSLKLIAEQKGMENYIPFLMLTKAHCLLYQGHAEKAYQIIEEYYPYLLDVFASPECMVLIKGQFVKGACLASFQKLEEALKIMKESLGSYERSTGFENDSLKGMGYRLLGEIYEAKDEFTKASQEYTKAEKFYEKILQEKSLDDLSILYTRLAILGAKLGDDTSLNKYLSLHIENFGLAHPRTFEIKKFLDDRGLSLQLH